MAPRKNTFSPVFMIIFFAGVLIACLSLGDNSFSYSENNHGIKAVSKTSRNRIGIGERLIYTTTIFSDQVIEIDMPEAENLGVFEIRDSGISRDRRLTGHSIRLWYELTVYETGKQVVPGLKIDYRPGGGQWNRIKSNDVGIYVQSVFERSKIEADIRPIEPPVGLKFPYKFHIIIGIPVLCVVVYLGVFFIRYRRRVLEKRRKGPAGNLLAYRKLSDNLALLDRKTEFRAGEFIKLSGLIRQYIGLNFRMDSSRSTTEEFLHSIRQYNDFYVKYGEGLSSILRTCDMAKFANYIPQAEEYKRALLLAGAIKNDVLPNEVQE